MSTDDKPRILVVDDIQDNLDLVSEVLEDDGYEIVTADSAEMALVLYKEQRPDLAILDVRMPETDGLDLCKRLREEFSSQPVPIVFLTAERTAADDAVRGLDLGACDYISKPCDRDEFRARVRAALRAASEQKHGPREPHCPASIGGKSD